MNGQKGLGYIIFENNEFKGPIANNLKEENLRTLKDLSNLENGDSIFFISDEENNAINLHQLQEQNFVMN